MIYEADELTPWQIAEMAKRDFTDIDCSGPQAIRACMKHLGLDHEAEGFDLYEAACELFWREDAQEFRRVTGYRSPQERGI